MADITIGSNTYQSYASVAFADNYLAADVARSVAWEATAEDDKARGLVTATRLLMRDVPWLAGVPDITAPPAAVQEATALLAPDILAKPKLGDSASTGSNVKSVTARGTGVEFFRGDDSAVTPVPSAVWSLLLAAGLIGSVDSAGGDPVYYSRGCQISQFDARRLDGYAGDYDERCY